VGHGRQTTYRKSGKLGDVSPRPIRPDLAWRLLVVRDTTHYGFPTWDSACVRLANWVRLRNVESGTDFHFINTHLDHVSQEAREQQARLIVEDSAAYPGTYPQLMTGDMNCAGDNAAIDCFRNGGWQDSHSAIHGADNPDTFHRFRGTDYDGTLGKIDWMFSRGQVTAITSQIVRQERDGRYMSDHDFIWADVALTAR
jgi:endonuclease/exonuclease/phosphatase family metal-dependent hydrolase